MGYALHVRRKSGEWQTEERIRAGALPREGSVAQVTFGDELISVRIGAPIVRQSKEGGDPFNEVRAYEF